MASSATPVDLCHIVTENAANSLLNTLLYGERKFLIWTRLCLENSSWVINTSDGVNVWKLEIDGQSLDSYRELSEIDTYETFFTKIRSDFLCGNLIITLHAEKITLTVGVQDTALSFDLYEASADDRKTELQILILRMADDIMNLTEKVKVSTESLERMKNQKGPAPSDSSIFDMPQKKVKAPTAKRKHGYSLVNPGSQNATVTDMAADPDSVENTVHLSVLNGSQMLDVYRCPNPIQCQFPCGKGSRRYHCPLCDNRPQKPGRMRRHFFLMHAGNHVIEHEGFRILRCKLKCARANGRITDCSHYHCCLCGRVCLRKVHLCCHLQAHTLGTAKDVEDDMIDTKGEDEQEEEADDDDGDDHDDTADETLLQTSQMACSIAGENENMVTLSDGTQVVYVQSMDNGESALAVVPVSSQSESMQIQTDPLNSSLQVLASSQTNNQIQELGTMAQDVAEQVSGDQHLEDILNQGQSRVVVPSEASGRSEPSIVSTGISSFHSYTSQTEHSQAPSSQTLHLTQSYSELTNEQGDPVPEDGNVVFEGASPTRPASHILQKSQDLSNIATCELANQDPIELSGVTNSLDINDLVSNAPVAASQVPSMEGGTSLTSPSMTSNQMITSADSSIQFQSPSKTIMSSVLSSQFHSTPLSDCDQSSRSCRGSENDSLPLLKSDGGPQEDDRVFSKLFENINPCSEDIFQHPSVVPERTGMNVGRCKNTECDCRLYHCPLCTCLPNKPGRIKEHFRKIHAENLIIKYRGYQMLRCKLGCCRPTGRRILNSHYHCFLCGGICISKPGVYEHMRTQHAQGTDKTETHSNDGPEKRRNSSTFTAVPAKKQAVDHNLTQLSPPKTKLEETSQSLRPLVLQVPNMLSGQQASNNNQRVSLDGQSLEQSGDIVTSPQQITVQLPDVQASPSQQQQQQQPVVILMPQHSQSYIQGQQQQQQPIVIVMPQGGGAGGIQMAQPIIVPVPQSVNN